MRHSPSQLLGISIRLIVAKIIINSMLSLLMWSYIQIFPMITLMGKYQVESNWAIKLNFCTNFFMKIWKRISIVHIGNKMGNSWKWSLKRTLIHQVNQGEQWSINNKQGYWSKYQNIRINRKKHQIFSFFSWFKISPCTPNFPCI